MNNAYLVDQIPSGLTPNSADCAIVVGAQICNLPSIVGQAVSTHFTLTAGSITQMVISTTVGDLLASTVLTNDAVLLPGPRSNVVTVTIIGKPTAIELVNFQAYPVSGVKCFNAHGADCAMIVWGTAQEKDVAGFALVRARSKNGMPPSRHDAEPVSFELIPASGGTGGEYSYLDRETYADSVYAYWLQEVDVNGRIHEYGPVVLPIDPIIWGNMR